MTYHTKAKILFCQRLGASWVDLANAVGIPPHHQARFAHGNEPAEIWDWLHYRDQLDDLPSALLSVDRGDLVEKIESLRRQDSVDTAGSDSIPLKSAQPFTMRSTGRRAPRLALRALSITLAILAVALSALYLHGHYDESAGPTPQRSLTSTPPPTAAPSGPTSGTSRGPVSPPPTGVGARTPSQMPTPAHEMNSPKLSGQPSTYPPNITRITATRNGTKCDASAESTFTINAYIFDESGVRRPTASYTVDGVTTRTPMKAPIPDSDVSKGSTWFVGIGPFALGAATTPSVTLTVTISATDIFDNPFSYNLTYNLIRC